MRRERATKQGIKIQRNAKKEQSLFPRKRLSLSLSLFVFAYSRLNADGDELQSKDHIFLVMLESCREHGRILRSAFATV